MDWSPPGSSVHGILQARILEWVAISFSRVSSQPRDQTQVSHIRGRCFNLLATREGSVVKLCSTLCDPMNCSSTPCFPVLHHFSELAQIHVHWVSDVIQLSHPLSFPSPPALSLSHHQGLFHWVSTLHQVAKVLELQLQHQSFQWRTFNSLGLIGWISLQSKGLSRVFSSTTIQKHRFFSAQNSLWSRSHIHTWLPEKP